MPSFRSRLDRPAPRSSTVSRPNQCLARIRRVGLTPDSKSQLWSGTDAAVNRCPRGHGGPVLECLSLLDVFCSEQSAPCPDPVSSTKRSCQRRCPTRRGEGGSGRKSPVSYGLIFHFDGNLGWSEADKQKPSIDDSMSSGSFSGGRTRVSGIGK